MLTKNVQRKKLFLLSPPLPTPNLTIVILCHSFPNVQINRLQQIHNFLACAVVKAFDCRFWYSGNTLDLINVVTLRQARLVPGWVTVFGRVNHLGAEPGTRSTQPSVAGWNEYPTKCGGVNRHIAWYTSPYPWSHSVVLVPGWTDWLAEISADLRETVAHQRRNKSTVTFFPDTLISLSFSYLSTSVLSFSISISAERMYSVCVSLTYKILTTSQPSYLHNLISV